MGILYFDVKHAITEHDKIINLSGGLHGMRDVGLLDSILDHVQNDIYYPTVIEKLTHIVFSIAKSHAFTDGNKRSAIVLGAFFLEINGYGSLVGRFILEMENIVLWVAKNILDKEFLLEINKNLIEQGYFTEEVKLKLFELFTLDNNPL